MAKAKAKPKPKVEAEPNPEPGSGPVPKTFDDFLRDQKFTRFVRNAALIAAKDIYAGPDNPAAEMVRWIDADDVYEAAKLAGVEEAIIFPPEELPEGVPHPVRGPLNNVFEILKNIDPTIKAAIVEALFRLIGLKV